MKVELDNIFGRHAARRLSAFAHGELSDAEAARVAEHLRSCATCRAEFDEIKFGIRLAETLPAREAPASLWGGIEASLARDSAPRARRATGARFRSLTTSRLAVVSCALVLLLVGGVAWLHFRPSPGGAWDVSAVAGAPTVGQSRVEKRGRLTVGEWLETDARSRAVLRVADIGEVEIDPGTRLRLVETGQTEHRIELEHGRVSARVAAPPRVFFVDTPSAVAADLGCAYTLEVDGAGRGLLQVTSGWVALEAKGRESKVPAGASCATQPGAPPGTPYFGDATPAFVVALSRFDFAQGGDEALSVVLEEARARDTLTLWHLLARTEASGAGCGRRPAASDDGKQRPSGGARNITGAGRVATGARGVRRRSLL
ncbi:MAG: FecR domain-containing protein [Acidobacteria bacterium]|nr:FecR domain-containing protein [Acidobacteriota bacterium]